jgi:regulator of protease activity HflC (stomatin/prohibitin superfamily)
MSVSAFARYALLLSLSGTACVTVGPGHAGVLWRASSGTQEEVYPEGLHSLAPWNRMDVYDLRSMNHDEVLTVIAVNGLAIELAASVRYRVVPTEVVALQREVGPSYYETILEPVLRSEARRVIGRYTPEELYSTKRDLIEREIREELRTKIEGRHLVLEAVLIRNIKLPDAIRDAIDEKLAAEQDVLKMKYVIEIARSTAEQKRIEAQGIADYNNLVSASLSGPILEFERIRELGKLAESPNSKTVVVGPSSGAPPLLLTAPAAAAPPKQ